MLVNLFQIYRALSLLILVFGLLKVEVFARSYSPMIELLTDICYLPDDSRNGDLNCREDITCIYLETAPFDLFIEDEEALFTGTGVDGNRFFPANAGLGVHTVQYTTASLTCWFTITVSPNFRTGTHNINPIEACPGYNPPLLTINGSSGKLPLKYEWFFGGTEVGTDENIYDHPQIAVDGIFSAFARVTDACGSSGHTDPKIYTIHPEPEIMILSNETVCQNSSLVLETKVKGGAGTFENYRWFSGNSIEGPWQLMDGATGASFQPPTDKPGFFNYRVTLNPNVASCNQTSAAISLEVVPEAFAHLEGGGKICQGEALQLRLILTGEPPWNLVITDGDESFMLGPIAGDPFLWTVYPEKSVTYQILSASDNRCSEARISGAAEVEVRELAKIIMTAPEEICRNAGSVPLVFYNPDNEAKEITYSINGSVQPSFVLLSLGSREISVPIVGIDWLNSELLSVKSLGDGDCLFMTEEKAVTRISEPAVSGFLAGGGEVCFGTTRIEVELTDYSGTVVWQKSSDSLHWQNIEGADDAFFPIELPEPLYGSIWIRVVISSGACSPAITAPVKFWVAPPIPEILYELLHPGCAENFGSITLTSPLGPGFSYSLNGSEFSVMNEFTDLLPGNHSLRVMNSSGCTSVIFFTIDSPPPMPEYGGFIVQNPDCQLDNGSIEFINSVDSGYLFSLNGVSFQADPKFIGLSAGSYTVYAMSNRGCISMEWITLESLKGAPASPEIEVVNPTCLHPFGSISIINNDDRLLYSFNNLPFSQLPNEGFGNLLPGVYSLAVRNEEGCITAIMVTIPEPVQISVSTVIKPVSCFEADDGAIDLTVLSGRDINIEWHGADGFFSDSASLSGLTGGQYSLVITNPDGCLLSADFWVETPAAPLSIETRLYPPSGCDLNDGFAEALISGGTVPYSVSWYNSEGELISNLERAEGLMAGSFFIEITDAGGCQIQEQFILEYLLPIECRDFIAYVDASGSYILEPNDFLVSGESDCHWSDIYTITAEPAFLHCADTISTIELQFRSRWGTLLSCSFNLTLLDTIPPLPVVRDTVLYLNENGTALLKLPSPAMAGSDNCGLNSIALSQQHFSCADLGKQPVILTLTDHYGNFAKGQFHVTIMDTISPGWVATDIELWFTASDTLWLRALMPDEQLIENCQLMTDSLSHEFFICKDEGEHTVSRYLIDNSGNIAKIDFSVTIHAGRLPDAVADTFMVTSGWVNWLDVVQNDNFSSGLLENQFLVVSGYPQFGTVNVGANGTGLEYRSENGFTGWDSIIYSLCSSESICGTQCDTATVIIRVMPVNYPPQAVNDRYELGNCLEFMANVLVNDTDPESDIGAAYVALIKPASFGELQLWNDGFFVYRAADHFTGLDYFLYEVCDTGFPALCDTAQVQLYIMADNNCDGTPDAFEIGLFIPEGFSPNGDGIGDFFRILGLENYPEAKLKVFDRWGMMVFEKRNYGNQAVWQSEEWAWWNGGIAGEPAPGNRVPRGNYFYQLELEKGIIHRGWITVAY